MGKTIKSDKDVKVLVTNNHGLMHSTTIKYKDKIFKLVSNHRNGDQTSIILMLSNSNGWVTLFNHFEICGIQSISYVADNATTEMLAVENYYAMVKQIKKVFV